MEFGSNSPGTGGFLSPKTIIKELGIIKKGMRVADFGCGHGYFTLPLAEMVGEGGRVFAIDVSPEALEIVNSKSKIDGKDNIEVKRCNLEKKGSCNVEEKSCDVVFIINLLFQTERDEIVIGEAKRILKENGNIVFIEWQPDVSFGPRGKRIAKEEAVNLFEKLGFKLEKDFPTDNYHYGLLFKK
jgi:ubiquinone/menaquinone biosynthesis C-methylase UbiE